MTDKVLERPVGHVMILPRHYPPLNEPVDVSIYLCVDKDGWIGWVGVNEKYGIRCCVSSNVLKRSRWWNVRKLVKDVVDDLDFLVDSYIIQKCDKIAPDLARVVDNLKKIVDVTKRAGDDHWKEVVTG
jgi:hypothetical protein